MNLLIILYRYFHEIFAAILYLHRAVIRQSIKNNNLSARITADSKYGPYFKDCVSVFNDTYIPAFVSEKSQIPWRNRKGWLSQNVLMLCDFEMMFRFVLPGWEGSAHDMRIFRYALNKKDLKPPPGKFYLGNANYTSGEYILTLYRDIKYYLKEQ